MKRRQSLSMKLLINRDPALAVVPPPPASASIREWFAGLALNNPELMTGIAPKDRVAESIRIADELISALATAKLPEAKTMLAPTEEDLRRWEEIRHNQLRPTMPAIKKLTIKNSVPPPANEPKKVFSLGSYSIIEERP